VRDKINHSTKLNTSTLSSSSRNKQGPENLSNSGFGNFLTANNTRLMGGSDEQLDKHQPYLLSSIDIDKFIDDPGDSDDQEMDVQDQGVGDSPAKTNISRQKQVSVSLCSKC
jgi:hypothetical protein